MQLIFPFIFENIEELKDIDCFNINPTRYIASSYGYVIDKKTGKSYYGISINSGYLAHHFELIDGTTSNLLIHRVIAETFFPDHNSDEIQVNHMNGKKEYNNAINLEWVTPVQNSEHAYSTGLANNYGENCYLSKLTNNEVEQICEYLSQGKTYREILCLMNMDLTNNNFDLIGNIKRGIAWKSISKNYNFPVITPEYYAMNYDQIRFVCESLEHGDNVKDIYKALYEKEYPGSRGDRVFYESFNRIKNRKIFTDISKDYNF